MIGKFISGIILFFAACVAIYFGVQLLASVWWILLIVAAVVAGIVLYVRAGQGNAKW